MRTSRVARTKSGLRESGSNKERREVKRGATGMLDYREVNRVVQSSERG
jgi:hypothetical protein